QPLSCVPCHGANRLRSVPTTHNRCTAVGEQISSTVVIPHHDLPCVPAAVVIDCLASPAQGHPPHYSTMLSPLSRAALLACAVTASLSAQAPNATERTRSVLLTFGSFDPGINVPEVPAQLRSSKQ